MENSFSPISLGIRAQWQPGPRCSGAAPPVLHYGVLQCLHDNGVKVNSLVFLRGWMWAQTMAGWALATLFAAGITGLVKST